MNSPDNTIHILTDEPETLRDVTAALASVGQTMHPSPCRTVAGLAERLAGSERAVAIVDIDREDAERLGGVETLSIHHPGTRFVVLSSSGDSRLMLRAMEAGARHFVLKSDLSGELVNLIQRLSQPKGGVASRLGTVTVLSAGGGCGASTVAVNLAYELAEARASCSLLIDLDDAYGGAAAYLGAEGHYGLADLLRINTRIDQSLIESTAVHHSRHLHLLLNPISVDGRHGAAYDRERVPEIVVHAASSYAAVVVDAPRVSREVAVPLARVSEHTLIVFQPAVSDIRTARRLFDTLVESGCERRRIHLVANRVRDGRTGVRFSDAVEAIGVNDVVAIRNDYKHASRCANLGQVLSSGAPRSTIRKDIRALAERVSRTRQAAAPPR